MQNIGKELFSKFGLYKVAFYIITTYLCFAQVQHGAIKSHRL